MKDFIDIIAGIVFAILIVILFWLYLIATPDQISAECEYQRDHMQKGGAL